MLNHCYNQPISDGTPGTALFSSVDTTRSPQGPVLPKVGVHAAGTYGMNYKELSVISESSSVSLWFWGGLHSQRKFENLNSSDKKQPPEGNREASFRSLGTFPNLGLSATVTTAGKGLLNPTVSRLTAV